MIDTHSWGTANLGQQLELFFLNNSTETEIGNHDIGIFSWCTEEEVLRLQIPVDYALRVKVLDGSKNGSDKGSGVSDKC